MVSRACSIRRGAVMHLLDEIVALRLPNLGESTHRRAALR